jgi:hypothetical protein
VTLQLNHIIKTNALIFIDLFLDKIQNRFWSKLMIWQSLKIHTQYRINLKKHWNKLNYNQD